MSALIRMRLNGYLRTQVAIVPLLAALGILGIFYGGGAAQPAEAYGMSAVVLFPVFAWQVKILLDVEPDVQRQIAITALGSPRREQVNGLIAGALTTSVTLLLAMILPWLIGGVDMKRSPVSFAVAILSGLWVHLVAIPPAIALGAMASRAISKTAGVGALVLLSGALLAIALGIKGSPVPWLMPPVMSSARAVVNGLSLPDAVLLTLWAVAWAAIVLFGYSRLRRTRP